MKRKEGRTPAPTRPDLERGLHRPTQEVRRRRTHSARSRGGRGGAGVSGDSRLGGWTVLEGTNGWATVHPGAPAGRGADGQRCLYFPGTKNSGRRSESKSRPTQRREAETHCLPVSVGRCPTLGVGWAAVLPSGSAGGLAHVTGPHSAHSALTLSVRLSFPPRAPGSLAHREEAGQPNSRPFTTSAKSGGRA